MRVGVLALQGDVAEHVRMLEPLAEPATVRSTLELESVDALILPGGESTTLSLLLDELGLIDPLKKQIVAGLPVFGTCAGTILLARELSALDVTVQRNAYGPQVESFEDEIDAGAIGRIRAAFIRAPVITATGPDVEVMATHEGNPVLVRQERILASTFHPEITTDPKLHEYFVRLAQ